MEFELKNDCPGNVEFSTKTGDLNPEDRNQL